MVLLNLSHKRQAKFPIIAIYSMIIYFPACLPSLFQCYHCWVICPKATIYHSPKTTQPSQTFVGNSCSTVECNLQNYILGSWNLSFTSHDKSFFWKWLCHHCIVEKGQGQILLASWGHLASLLTIPGHGEIHPSDQVNLHLAQQRHWAL